MCQRFHISLLVERKQEEDTSYDKASVKVTMNNGEIVEGTRHFSRNNKCLSIYLYHNTRRHKNMPVSLQSPRIQILNRYLTYDMAQKHPLLKRQIRRFCVGCNLWGNHGKIELHTGKRGLLINLGSKWSPFLCCKNLIDITCLWSRKNGNDVLKKGRTASMIHEIKKKEVIFMKKIGTILLATILICSLAGCIANKEENQNPVVRGVITEVNSQEKVTFLLVEGKQEEDTSYGKASVKVTKRTKIHRNEEEAKVEDLEEGMTVEIYYRGGVDMSYPVLMGADKIIILE